MMPPKELAQYALLVLRQIDKLGPLDRAAVLHVATAIVTVEVQQVWRPAPVRDE